MTEPVFRNDVEVILADVMGNERSIIRRARVSTSGEWSLKPKDGPRSLWKHVAELFRKRDPRKLSKADLGLLKMLYRDKHGVPFEGVEFELYFRVPIFVSRQIVKHRISSINEESGRYREMAGEFYVIDDNRKVQQVGKTSAYKFVESDPELIEKIQAIQKDSARDFWQSYNHLLDAGVSKEVARQHMPVNTYSSMYFKTNLRALLNFLSLRKDWEGESVYPSHPQYEITLVADQIAEYVKQVVPNVYDAFIKGGMRPV